MFLPFLSSQSFQSTQAGLNVARVHTAARAVGRACATNQAAGVIPCHRAVGAGGALTGYRWGVARKERLLADERRRSST